METTVFFIKFGCFSIDNYFNAALRYAFSARRQKVRSFTDIRVSTNALLRGIGLAMLRRGKFPRQCAWLLLRTRELPRLFARHAKYALSLRVFQRVHASARLAVSKA
ncbi:MAG: hypothetical protein RSD99_16515 [Janthinobacterium sp.]